MTNFEPFDLKRAEAGEPVMFRDCTDKVEFKCALHDANGSVRSLLFVHTNSNGFERELTRHPDGTPGGEDVYSTFDIVMKPKPPVTKTFWTCFQLNNDETVLRSCVTSREPKNHGWDYVIPIEIALLSTNP